MVKPILVIIDGPMGAGKSTVAKLLHSKMKRTALISLDRIKHLLSDFETDNMDDLQLASDVGIVMVKTYLSRGFNVIVEKAFTKAEHVNNFIKSTKKKANLFVYQIDAPLHIRIKRVNERPTPLDTKKKPTLEKIKRNSSNYEKFKYKKARVFDSSILTPEQIVRNIQKDISYLLNKK